MMGNPSLVKVWIWSFLHSLQELSRLLFAEFIHLDALIVLYHIQSMNWHFLVHLHRMPVMLH
jgi:hypothetical protein